MNSKFLFLITFTSLIFVFNSSNTAFAEHPDSSAELAIHEKIKWLETNYSSTGTAIVQVVYPGMNFDPKEIDNFDVDVWSDTDFAGIDLTITETGDATGIFEGTVFFTITDDTSGHRLRVSHGDTIYSKFDGNTLHESLNVDKNDLISTASMNGAGIPIDDRVSLDKKSYAWNDKVIITINAPEENFDANSIEIIDSSKDSIKIYTRHFGIDNYNLVETGINSGIFSGEIILTGEFNNIDSDGITASFEYEEDKTAIGSAPIVLNHELESESIMDDSCGVDTVSIDGVCQVKVEKIKTMGDDAPFFGIFVYLDDLISWIFGNTWNDTVGEKKDLIDDDKTIIDKYKDLPEVIAFYAEYENAQVSVRKDHISYFVGSPDDYLLRMNLEFNENYEIENKEFHCYYNKTAKWEMSQESIVKNLAIYDCGQLKSYSESNEKLDLQ